MSWHFARTKDSSPSVLFYKEAGPSVNPLDNRYEKTYVKHYFVFFRFLVPKKKFESSQGMARPRAGSKGAAARAAGSSKTADSRADIDWAKSWVTKSKDCTKEILKERVEHLDLHQADLVMGRLSYIGGNGQLSAALRNIKEMVDVYRVH